MATCLLVEDGSIVPGSNTYITLAEAEPLVNSIGESFGSTPDATIEKNLLKAMRMLESYRGKYQGNKISGTQPLQFPRDSVYIDGYLLGSGTIPNELKMAQALIALMTIDGVELQGVTDSRSIIQETIGNAISVTYSDNGASSDPRFPLIETYLRPLLKSASMNGKVYRA